MVFSDFEINKMNSGEEPLILIDRHKIGAEAEKVDFANSKSIVVHSPTIG